MTWVKIDDAVFGHPKVRAVDPPARLLWVVSICYSGHYLTDGELDKAVLPMLLEQAGAETGHVEQLVAADLWHEAEHGWTVARWGQHNRTKAQVDAAVARKAEWRAAKAAKKASDQDRDAGHTRRGNVAAETSRDRRATSQSTEDRGQRVDTPLPPAERGATKPNPRALGTNPRAVAETLRPPPRTDCDECGWTQDHPRPHGHVHAEWLAALDTEPEPDADIIHLPRSSSNGH